ncbi:MAG: hypothetical protein CVU89_08995 [Firmicutes bacterium HGW-Firmicutes-14]|jgi:uncharacterized membrane protein|nr:MAG: hypothetical protein CVU89_08995 [Firmicutes bacterium HGW-Firmicutes-14]
MKYRFLIYGLMGITMEILWTGAGSLLKGDMSMRGFSYLWMFPIYGAAVFLEPLHERIRDVAWYGRGIIWIAVIFSIEFITGRIIQLTVGLIPWDYSGTSRYSVAGLIRLDYAPVWFVVGLLFEQGHDLIMKKLH